MSTTATTQEVLSAKLRSYGEIARPSGNGIHVPQFGRMNLTQATKLLAWYEAR